MFSEVSLQLFVQRVLLFMPSMQMHIYIETENECQVRIDYIVIKS